MKSKFVSKAERYLDSGSFQAALEQLVKEIEVNSSVWYPYYLAGQCERVLGDNNKALEYLKDAVRLNESEDPSVLQALAIAYQANGQLNKAVMMLRRALEADPDHLISLNSLGMTQKMMGEPEKASHNYNLALEKLAHSIVRKMTNKRQNPIYKHAPWEEAFNIWAHYAMNGAMYLAVLNEIDEVALPNGEMAAKEEVTEEHEGLYWTDSTDEKGKCSRIYWPNYFTTFREELIGNDMYFHLLGNRSTVLGMLGQNEESERYLNEALFIQSKQDSVGIGG